MMLTSLLLLLQAVADPQTHAPRPPRPSDTELIASVQAEVTEGRVLSSTFGATPRGGGWVGCGLIETAGGIEPFSVMTFWKPAQRRMVVLSQITMPGEDGRPVTHDVPPPAPEPAHWSVTVSVAPHLDVAGDGFDRQDRNLDALKRRTALATCKRLTPPPGTTWTVELEPDPDPVRAERNRRRARAATDLIFGPTSRDE